MKHSLKFALLTLAIITMAGSAMAGTITVGNADNITATVTGSCQWTSGFSMNFATAYDPFSAAANTASTTITFKCVKNTNAGDQYKIWFNNGGGFAMTGATTGDSLTYTLTGPSGAVATNVGAAQLVAGSAGIGAAKGYSFALTGTLDLAQDVSVDSYKQTVTANVEY